jgi:hypothetical protein
MEGLDKGVQGLISGCCTMEEVNQAIDFVALTGSNVGCCFDILSSKSTSSKFSKAKTTDVGICFTCFM